MEDKISVRSIFISDVHLGCKFSNSGALLKFLDKFHHPEYLYIIGDFIDGWKMRRRTYWDDNANFLLSKIIGYVKKSGTRVTYIVGNHDEFLRVFLHDMPVIDFGSIHIMNETYHHTADGKKFLIIHGDKFDTVVRHAKWLVVFGDIGYEILLHANSLVNWCRCKMGKKYWSLSKATKAIVKEGVNYIGNYEYCLAKYTKEKRCHGVICGHIHTPDIKEMNGIEYCNTGDWMESCSAIVEHHDGRLELFNDQFE